MKRVWVSLISVLLSTVLISSCSGTGVSESGGTGGEEDGTAYRGAETTEDLTSAVTVLLSDDGSSSSGDGVKCDGGSVTVTESGSYIISGTVSDGRVTVDVSGDGQVELIFDGVNITSSDGPAIYVRESESVRLTLANGSRNTVSDSEYYEMTDGDSTIDAAVYSRDDLVISGTGELTVNGEYKHGIVSKNSLEICGGEVNVTSQKTGIYGKDSVEITDGTITVNAGSDGIKSDNSEDAECGYVRISGGTLDINAGFDGVQAETNLTVEGGTVTLQTGGGSDNASVRSDGSINGAWGAWNPMFSGDSLDSASSDSAKGLKAGDGISISGGSVNIDSSDDAVHSNGNVRVSGGTVTVISGDDGVHADSEFSITEGIVSITGSYEGIEASVIAVSGGRISVKASDDGLNAAGGNDSSSVGSRPGAGMFSSSTGEIRISGGYIYIDADGDGVDSNGSISVTGGITLVCGPVSSGNGALDYDGTASVEGGVVVALGGAGRAQGFSEASGQGAVACTFDSQNGGTPLVLADSDGYVIASLTADKAYSSAVITAPGLKVGGSYRIVVGETPEGADEHGYADSGSISGGTLLCEIELDSSVYQSGGMSSFGGGGVPGERGGNNLFEPGRFGM